MRRRLLFVEVEGDPPDGKTAPIYSLYAVMDALKPHLESNTWQILCYGEQWFNEGETQYHVDARIDGGDADG